MARVLAFPERGFVLLFLPKTASTTLERALAPYASQTVRTAPGVKHVGVRGFERRIAPQLAAMGHGRDSYEVVTMFREPLAWLESWWRYRARTELAARRPERSTTEISFEDYALSYVAHDGRLPIPKGRPGRFITVDGIIGVDRIFAVERPEVWQTWFSDRLGRDLDFGRLNASTAPVHGELSDETEAALRAYLSPEYDVWHRLVPTGELSGIRGTPLVVPDK